ARARSAARRRKGRRGRQPGAQDLVAILAGTTFPAAHGRPRGTSSGSSRVPLPYRAARRSLARKSHLRPRRAGWPQARPGLSAFAPSPCGRHRRLRRAAWSGLRGGRPPPPSCRRARRGPLALKPSATGYPFTLAPMRWGVLRHRPFALLFAGQAISSLGDRLVPVALAFAVLGITGSVTDLGIVLAA